MLVFYVAYLNRMSVSNVVNSRFSVCVPFIGSFTISVSILLLLV